MALCCLFSSTLTFPNLLLLIVFKNLDMRVVLKLRKH